MQGSLTWYGHGTWSLDLPEGKVVLDPFFDANPSCPVKADDVEADWILISHGHEDHTADVARIAKRTGATIVSNWEICQWYGKHRSLDAAVAMNTGGAVSLPFGRVKYVHAVHSSSMPDGSYAGNPGGFMLTIEDRLLYFACDTAFFSDMELYGRQNIDLAVLPIGDLFTMGPEDSILAILELTPTHVAPAHFNTWPPIEQDAQKWARDVREKTGAVPHLFVPGEAVPFDVLFGSA